MKPINLGIIGTGIAARELHWPALKQMKKQFSIAMACNRSQEKLDSYAELVGGCETSRDYMDVIKNDDIDAVCVALPFHLNIAVTEAALNTGKHVIVEKPIASNFEGAAKMRALENAHPKQITMVAENLRYRKLFKRAKEMIDNADIGTPYSVMWNYFFFVNPETNQYANTPWRMESHYPGGFIVDAGVHHIAVLRMLFGEIVSFDSCIKGVTPELGLYDTFSMLMQFENGLSGSLNLFFSSKGLRSNMLHVFGDQGTLVIDRESIVLKREGRDDIRENHSDDMGYLAEFTDFHQAITSGTAVQSSFAEGCKDFKGIMKGVLSAIDKANNNKDKT